MFAFTSCPQVVSNQRLFPKQQGTILVAGGSNSTLVLGATQVQSFLLPPQSLQTANRPGLAAWKIVLVVLGAAGALGTDILGPFNAPYR